MSAGAVLALVGAAVLVFVASVVAFRGWPGLTQASSTQRVVLPASPDRPAAEQTVVLGGRQRAGAQRRAPSRRPAAGTAARPAAAAEPAGVVTTVRPQSAGAPTVSAGRPAPAAPAQPAERVAPEQKAADPVQQVVEAPLAPVDRIVEPADRDGLAGAADDVVGTLDKLIP